MNKLFILIITLAMVFSIAACGKSDTTGSSLQSGEKPDRKRLLRPNSKISRSRRNSLKIPLRLVAVKKW